MSHRDDELKTVRVACPYCGERIACAIDCSVVAQEYIEDCHVCCRPIALSVFINEHGQPRVQARTEEE